MRGARTIFHPQEPIFGRLDFPPLSRTIFPSLYICLFWAVPLFILIGLISSPSLPTVKYWPFLLGSFPSCHTHPFLLTFICHLPLINRLFKVIFDYIFYQGIPRGIIRTGNHLSEGCAVCPRVSMTLGQLKKDVATAAAKASKNGIDHVTDIRMVAEGEFVVEYSHEDLLQPISIRLAVPLASQGMSLFVGPFPPPGAGRRRESYLTLW